MDITTVHWFTFCLVTGLFLIAAEIFIPGGILGVLGSFFLFAAIVLSFSAFDTQTALLVSIGTIVLSGIIIGLAMKLFPKSRMGKGLILEKDASRFKSADQTLDHLLDKKGITETPLSPAGIATIDNERVDVISESSWIDDGTPIHVIHIEGNVVTVREADTAA